MSTTAITAAVGPLAPEKVSQWFSEMISTLQADHFNLKNDLAPEDTKKMYQSLITRNQDQLNSQMQEMSSSYFIEKTFLTIWRNYVVVK